MLKGLGKYRVQGHVSGQRKIGVTAGLDMAPLSGGGGATTGASTMTSATAGQFMKPLLEGFVNPNNGLMMRQLYEDIYYHDAISGTAVDLMAAIPFSPFSLSGLPDQEMTDVYADSAEALQVPTLFPELTRDYLVKGDFIANFNYDDNKKKITSIMPFDPNICAITPVPIYGRDPLIDVMVPQKMHELVQKASSDPRLQYLLNQYGDDIAQMVKEKVYPLDPRYTLYIPRRTFSTQTTGTSYYRRVIPVWLLEKALMRGTMDLAYRRQKSILQIIAGDDEWEPTDAQLQQLVQLYLQADMDPTGAIIATRPSVMTSEVRSGGDFWKIDDSYQLLTEIKLRALHVSDAFVTGETVLTTMDTTLSVLLEDIRAFRDMVTRKVFYQKIFPLIAKENDFRIENKKYEIAGSAHGEWRTAANLAARGKTWKDPETGEFHRVVGQSQHKLVLAGRDGDSEFEIDIRDYYTPRLTWHKSLKPEADSAYLDIMNSMGEKGMPITLRMLAAVGGMNLPDIMASLEDDIKVRNKVADYQKRLPKSIQQQADEMFGNVASFAINAENQSMAQVISNMWDEERRKQPRKKNRDFTEYAESQRDPETKKILSRKGRAVLSERINKHGAELAARFAQRENRQLRDTVPYTATGGRTTIFGNT